MPCDQFTSPLLSESSLKNLSVWYPMHLRRAERAYAKIIKGGSLTPLWRDAYNRHADMAGRMDRNLTAHYEHLAKDNN